MAYQMLCKNHNIVKFSIDTVTWDFQVKSSFQNSDRKHKLSEALSFALELELRSASHHKVLDGGLLL